MKRLPLTRVALIFSLMIAAAPGAGAQPAVQESPDAVARLLGLAPGATRADLKALQRKAGVTCEQGPVSPGARVVPVSCAASLGLPIVGAPTFWFVDGRLDRAFIVDGLTSRFFSDYEAHFQLTQAWVSYFLGPPAVPAALPPAWAAGPP